VLKLQSKGEMGDTAESHRSINKQRAIPANSTFALFYPG
jgi:hypothetical protein